MYDTISHILRVSDTSKYLVGVQSDLDPRKAKYFLETEANNLMQPIIGNAVINGNGEQVMTTVKVSVTDKNVLIRRVKLKKLQRSVRYIMKPVTSGVICVLRC